jgi:dolichyl-phosphate-mannose--protein O-mannosyl transferase
MIDSMLKLQETLQSVSESKGTELVISKSRWQRILHWEYLGLFILVAVTLVFHFVAIEKPPTIVWDEVWYVGDTRSIVTGSGDLRPEHPPLSKLFIVAGEYIFNGFSVPEKDTGVQTARLVGGDRDNDTLIPVSDAAGFQTGAVIRIGAEQMEITEVDASGRQITVKRGAGGSDVSSHPAQQPVFEFTDNAFGWRFFSIVFGEIGIIVFYFICRRLKFSLRTTLLATFLFALEDMTFLHGGLALLDVYMVTFLLVAVLCYLDERYILCGIFVALSANCKLSGALIILALLLHWVIYRRTRWKTLVGSLFAAALAFVFFLVLSDLLLKGSLENPLTRIQALVTSTAANQFTDPKLDISSRPWTWIYPQWVQVFDANPPNVPFLIYSYNPQYISFISSTLQILIVPAIGYMIFKAVRGSSVAGLVLLWFLTTYLIWIPLDIVSNRVTFVFYFLSTTPAICIGIGMGLADVLDALKTRRIRFGRITNGVKAAYAAVMLYLLVHLAIFIVFNPAIPPIIKTWLPPFAGMVSPPHDQSSPLVSGIGADRYLTKPSRSAYNI